MELTGFRAGKLLPRNVILDMRQQQILDDERSAQDLVFGVVNNGHPRIANPNLDSPRRPDNRCHRRCPFCDERLENSSCL